MLSQIKHYSSEYTGNYNPILQLVTGLPLYSLITTITTMFALSLPLPLRSQYGDHWGREVSDVPHSTFWLFWVIHCPYCQCECTYALKIVSTEVCDLEHSKSLTPLFVFIQHGPSHFLDWFTSMPTICPYFLTSKTTWKPLSFLRFWVLNKYESSYRDG